MTHHFGLKKARFKDPRQFKFHKTFGAFPISSVPDAFDFGTVPAIKDQGPTHWCTSFSGSYVIDNILKDITSPEYIAQKTVLVGKLNPVNFTGTTPQLSDKALVKFGSILRNLSPFLFGRDDPNQIADPKNWPASLDAQAKDELGASFEITTDGYQDLFDAIRAALYVKKLPVRLAVWFQPSWESASDGIVSADMVQNFQPDINGHSIQVDPAVVLKNGVQYLRVPNSWGTGVGDKGYYYFSREAVNLTFYVSAYDPESNVEAVKGEQWNVFTFIFDELVSIFRAITNLFK